MALIVSRHAGETILIGDGITITVLHLSPSIVRLEIDAPRDQRIRRGEHAAAEAPLEAEVERLKREIAEGKQ